MRTRFTEAFGLSTPIAQAGMAFVGMTPDLAVAVSNAGDLPDADAAGPVIGEMVLGGQTMPMHRFSNLVPMRGATTGDFDEMALLSG
ncbi:hypothetical protein [Dactylosporangium sp. CA-092794]|uniref:hypothetical protein n=1 Tax=Dactylosporangium sp. CA-092794 TaxID=3239929 RepID=UPI003D8D4AB0